MTSVVFKKTRSDRLTVERGFTLEYSPQPQSPSAIAFLNATPNSRASFTGLRIGFSSDVGAIYPAAGCFEPFLVGRHPHLCTPRT
jgi:hypothetical protein